MPYGTLSTSHRIHFHDTKHAEPDRGNWKPPIVMIHGLGSSQNFYMPVIPFLPDYRCIALDSYGAARSKSQGERLTIEQLAEDVVALLDHLDVEKAVIVGHSMGGTMVHTIAAAHPERVVGVVSIGPVNPSSVKPEMFQTRIDTVSKDGMEPLANTIPTSATASNSTPLQRALICELILGQDPKSYASHCKAIMEMKEAVRGFDAIEVPALILAGEEDKSAPLEGCRYIYEHLGSSKKELKVLKSVGHWHCIEAGELVASEIAAFCSSL
ncbi:hypothetical protein B0A55_11811 [Friedmanniomyces simplex]|uniref:AB hydrolase-1 domain-containing protein n=1 Tax=Friedmanniomyces simplex TaxID=329884 RepID=A0A4U0WAP6_9PEZI|nr:hypothetical protein B0A55_11811 [Friedmanniomyces simplex]